MQAPTFSSPAEATDTEGLENSTVVWTLNPTGIGSHQGSGTEAPGDRTNAKIS